MKNTYETLPVPRYTDTIKIPLPVYRGSVNTENTGNTGPKIPIPRYTGCRYFVINNPSSIL